MIPVEKTTIEQAAGVTGGILGLILAGPVGAIVFAAISNFVAKKDNEAGEAIRGVGKTIVESFNFLTKLNDKYNLTGKAATAIGGAVSSIETESEALETVKNTLTTGQFLFEQSFLHLPYAFIICITSIIIFSNGFIFTTTVTAKVDELNKEYDLVGKGAEALKAAAAFSDTAIEKVIELNEKVFF